MRSMNAVIVLSQSVVFCLFTVLSANASAHNYCLYPLPFQTPLSHIDLPAPPFFTSSPSPLSWDSLWRGGSRRS